MLIREFYKINNGGKSLYKTYSSENYYIQQVETGTKYTEAIDVENAPYTYIETTEKIADEEEQIIE